jgi:hypothetical protein
MQTTCSDFFEKMCNNLTEGKRVDYQINEMLQTKCLIEPMFCQEFGAIHVATGMI